MNDGDTNASAPLSGDTLLQFMDRLEADLEEEGGSGQAIALPERLAAQPLRADSLKAIERLSALWRRAGDDAAAWAVIETDGAALLQTLALPKRREIEVRLARLQARARYAQGDLAGALALCETARYALDDDGTDDFVGYELPWLLEAGQLEAAGELAFFRLYQAENVPRDDKLADVLRVVHERLADPADTSVWWPLCVMRACYDAHTLYDLLVYAAPTTPWAEVSKTHQALFDSLSAEENFFGKDSDSRCEARYDGIFTAARSLAEARAPGHPWIRRLAAEQDYARGRIDRATQIALLETVIREGLGDNLTAYLLFDARLERLFIII
jgi:hypothetical protein